MRPQVRRTLVLTNWRPLNHPVQPPSHPAPSQPPARATILQSQTPIRPVAQPQSPVRPVAPSQPPPRSVAPRRYAPVNQISKAQSYPGNFNWVQRKNTVKAAADKGDPENIRLVASDGNLVENGNHVSYYPNDNGVYNIKITIVDDKAQSEAKDFSTASFEFSAPTDIDLPARPAQQ